MSMSMSSLALAVRVASAITLAAATATADVLVVDAAGAGEFTDPSIAFAAAASGDVVLIRAGTYVQSNDSYLVSNKSLTIVADGPVTLSSFAAATFDAGQRVVLRGLDFVAIDMALGFAFDGPGQLHAEDCTFTGDDAISSIFGGLDGTAGARVFNGGHAAFEACTFTGGKGAVSFPFATSSFLPSNGGPALSVDGSSVSLHRCTLLGGTGGDNLDAGPDANTIPAKGGAGIAGFDATVLLSGGSATGGTGGLNEVVAPGGAGGAGVALAGTSDLRETLDATIVGGPGGADPQGSGPQGVDRDVVGSQLVYQANSRDYTIGGPTREGGVVTITYDGEPGDLLGVFVSLAPDAVPLPSAKGTFLLGAPLIGNLLTLPIDATGTLSLDVPVPDLGFGPDDALVLFEQGFVLGQTDGKVLTGPTVHVVLDDTL